MDEVTQVLFGMDGFRVLGAVVDPLDGELGVVVETISPVGIPPLAGGLVMKLEGTAVPTRGVRTRRGWCGSARRCTR